MTADDSPAERKHVIYTRHEKNCRECGTPFISKRIDAQFCNGTCHRKFYDRESREKIRERKRRYAETHKDERREYHRRYYEKHRDEIRSEDRQRRILISADPEKAAADRERKRQDYLKNRDRILERAKDRRALERSYRKLSAHGTDYDQLVAALWEAQDGKCYLCSDPLRRDDPREVHLDHDHACCPLGKTCERCRRGLACKRCNYLISQAKDDPVRLRRIADNLEKANEAVRERMQQPRPIRARTSWDLTCQYCGIPFMGYRQDTFYCSTRCANSASEERRGLREPGVPWQVAEPAPCKQCGEVFERRTRSALYCSDPCRKAAERQRNKARLAAAKGR